MGDYKGGVRLVGSVCIAQNVRFEIPYKVLYFETPFLIIFKCYAWVSCGHRRIEAEALTEGITRG